MAMWIVTPEKQCNKLGSHSITGFHLGLAIGKKAFVIFDPSTHQLHESHNVHFFEGTTNSECITIEIPEVDSPSHVMEDSPAVPDAEGVEGGVRESPILTHPDSFQPLPHAP